MKPKHTPGPWKYNPTVRRPRSDLDKELGRNPKGRWLSIQTGDVCTSFGGDPICKVYFKINAPIIAAAPEMLKALKDALDWMRRYSPSESHFYEITQVQAAISKAEREV